MHSAGWLGDWCLTELSAQTGYILPQEYEIYYVGGGDTKDKHTLKQRNNKTPFGVGFVETIFRHD